MATDAELSAKVEKFLTAKTLYGVTEDPKVQQKAFEDLELYEDSKLHLNLEQTFAEWKQIQQTQHRAKAR